MDRKKFIVQSLCTAVSISTFGHIFPTATGFKGDCTTTDDILGPFYRPNAPTRNDLTQNNLYGNTLNIKGFVYGPDCTSPIEKALVEIWHCDTDGNYDNNSPHYHHRAKWFTNAKGLYQFKTQFPGKYLNGKQYRPAHIHFKVSAPKHQTLISQVYFKGDPHITEDQWAASEKAKSRILPIILEDIKGNLTINFNIYLKHKV